MPAKREWKYLERNPRSTYRQLYIKDTKFTARTLYGQMVGEDARSPEQIAADFGIPLEAVLEAIEYCESKPPEIDQDYRYDELLMEASGMNHPDYKYNPKKYYRTVPTDVRAKIYREAYPVESDS